MLVLVLIASRVILTAKVSTLDSLRIPKVAFLVTFQGSPKITRGSKSTIKGGLFSYYPSHCAWLLHGPSSALHGRSVLTSLGEEIFLLRAVPCCLVPKSPEHQEQVVSSLKV